MFVSCIDAVISQSLTANFEQRLFRPAELRLGIGNPDDTLSSSAASAPCNTHGPILVTARTMLRRYSGRVDLDSVVPTTRDSARGKNFHCARKLDPDTACSLTCGRLCKMVAHLGKQCSRPRCGTAIF